MNKLKFRRGHDSGWLDRITSIPLAERCPTCAGFGYVYKCNRRETVINIRKCGTCDGKRRVTGKRERLVIRRLDFFWWGKLRTRRGGFPWNMWLQWGPMNMCADKDHSVMGRGWLIGPLQVTLWDRPNWRDFLYTKAEAAEVDRQERAEMRQARIERGELPTIPPRDG